MNSQLSPEEIERLARKRASAKMGWYTHVAIYALVNTFLYFRSDFGFGHRAYSLGPALGWGLGVVFHGISVFVLGRGSSFRERMVQKERERLMRRHGPGS